MTWAWLRLPLWDMLAGPRKRWVPLGLAAVVGLVVVGLAQGRFPPAGDGTYYDIVARRISEGHGYTWLWPDGVVTYAAHYPVGYPALLGGLYALFGPHPVLAMVLNVAALMGVVWAVRVIVEAVASPRASFFASVAAVFHPTLLFYLPLMMTELLSASLLAVASAVAVGKWNHRWFSRRGRFALVGLVLGVAVLVRPQQLLFAPFLGMLGWYRSSQRSAVGAVESGTRNSAGAGEKGVPLQRWRQLLRASLAALAVTSVAVAVCLPWTIRNQIRMKSPVFVSANAGWNLLIGTSPRGRGGWASVDDVGLPPECRLVFDEVKKDTCFGAAAKRRILGAPLAFLRLVPNKLERTFDDVGAPGWYLQASNPGIMTERAKTILGGAEVVTERGLLLLLLLGLARCQGERVWWRRILAGTGALCCLVPMAWVAVLLFVVGAVSLGSRLVGHPPMLLAALGLGCTALVHGAFFGGARYAVVVVPLVLAAAFAACRSSGGVRAGET